MCGIQESDTENVGDVVVINTDTGVLRPRTLGLECTVEFLPRGLGL